jgi:dTDP-4-amino-4,6-dideoxygalactose transaminase
MKVPLLDLDAQYRPLADELQQAIRLVMESQHFILGPQVQACERLVAGYCGCAHGIGVSSGTDALLLCLMAESIGPGDEVITTPYTFFATAGAIARLGATPVFVDIDPATFNIHPEFIEARITTRTKAIMPVHLFGQSADMTVIMDIASRNGLVVIEDAAQAIGADHCARRVGSIGAYGCLSFFPSKNLGAAGDGGMVVTNDDERAEKLRCLRAHGSKPKYHHKYVGGNFRLDTIQAAIVSVKLPHLDGWTEQRNRNAERYERLFRNAGLTGGPRSPVVLPTTRSDRHVYNQFVIRVSARDALRAALHTAGVGTEIYYPVPMHLQECFSHLGYRAGDFPESEGAAAQTLALPIYPELTDEQASYVVNCIGGFFQPPAGLRGDASYEQSSSR